MRYTCHIIVHVYDGVSTIPKQEIIEVEADKEEDAKSQAYIQIRDKYRILSHLSLSSMTVISVKETDNP